MGAVASKSVISAVSPVGGFLLKTFGIGEHTRSGPGRSLLPPVGTTQADAGKKGRTARARLARKYAASRVLEPERPRDGAAGVLG